MKYYDTRRRREMEDRRKVADRRTANPLGDLIRGTTNAQPPVIKGDEPKSLRDEFAMEAFKILLNDQSLRESDDTFYEEVAKDAYGYADAAMDARRAGEE